MRWSCGTHQACDAVSAQTREIMPECGTADTSQTPVGARRVPSEERGRMSNSRPEIMEDPLAVSSRFRNKLHSLWLAWTYPFASIGKKVSVHFSCDLPRSRARYIRIGNRVALGRRFG